VQASVGDGSIESNAVSAPGVRPGAQGDPMEGTSGTRVHAFVVGCSRPPDAAVESLGGTVVMRRPDGLRVLAVLPADGFAKLYRHPDVALAAPVTVDAERFASFARLTGFDGRADRRQQRQRAQPSSSQVGCHPTDPSSARSAAGAARATVTSLAATPLGAAHEPGLPEADRSRGRR
jgi:hypothetical protein